MDPGVELAALLADHDATAHADAFRDHSRAVVSRCRLSGWTDDAEDVAQDVFERLWTHPDRYDPARGPLRSYLVVDATGRTIDAGRAQRSRRRREDREAATRSGTPEISADVTALHHDRSRVLHEVLAQLPDRERVPILLAFFTNLTYREVALELGEPEGTVKSRIRSGLARLAGLLRAQGVTLPSDL